MDLLNQPQKMETQWGTSADIQKRDGVSRQAVSKRIKKFEAGGHTVRVKDGRGWLINLAEYDRLTGAEGDARAETGEQTKRADSKSKDDGGLRGYQKRIAAADAEMREINLAKEKGLLVKKSDVAADAVRVASEIVKSCPAVTKKICDMFETRDRKIKRAEKRHIESEIRTWIAGHLSRLVDEGENVTRPNTVAGTKASELRLPS